MKENSRRLIFLPSSKTLRRLQPCKQSFSFFGLTIRCSIQLKSFSKFQDTTEALAAATALVESKLSPQLSEFLRKNVLQGKNKEKLAVADKILGSAIKKELGIKLAAGSLGSEVFRGIRSQLTNLVKQLDEDSVNAMTLGLSHSLSRYKLKFSPDKVDVMIVQAVGKCPAIFLVVLTFWEVCLMILIKN